MLESVSKNVAEANSAVRYSTRFQSISADVEFGCMLRMDNGGRINDDGCFGADQWDGCWDGDCWCFSDRFGRVCHCVGWMVAVRECLLGQPCLVSVLLGSCCAVLVQRIGIAVVSRVCLFVFSNR